MTREQAKELLPVLQAYAEGKTVQMKNFGGDWMDCEFCVTGNEWRVKPEAREFWIAVDQCGPTFKPYGVFTEPHPCSSMCQIVHVREVIE